MMITRFEIFENNESRIGYLKLFEDTSPDVGDYVICKDSSLSQYPSSHSAVKAYNFILNNIGRIIVKESDGFLVTYKSIPQNIKKFFDSFRNIRSFEIDEILFYGKTQQSVRIQQKAQQFDL